MKRGPKLTPRPTSFVSFKQNEHNIDLSSQSYSPTLHPCADFPARVPRRVITDFNAAISSELSPQFGQQAIRRRFMEH
ncbi:hypothetical protein CYMTET_19612 [Cymbomonas tetramitiformis]|uniref:Uncharacterized protein n=1 Tax=Cymbomonas tetramitiformis TaxID=36881 RepID=A0AAE0G5P3_9CHLO|nr:hypothetical protein CYMTET_19612 [Cymbomonas tetramitiformis]